ncbi:hypothetical protein OC842_003482 [Tilletia horrida]|uniref:Uncharacterized protein n=1 Tax=Tilletia horrida TaxID=155126 RepID=A0AAN6GBM0_9BASI|nr:hypothetical protein OC842_003482 [Tilletia horrida]
MISHHQGYSPVLEAWAARVAAAPSPGRGGGHSLVAAAGAAGGAPIWELIKVIASSIIEVMLISGVGYILARRGVIDKKTQTKINKLNVSFFTPALLFSKVAFTLNPARLAELYIVPIGFVIITLVSTVGALLLSKVARLSKAQRNFAIACAISPNSNSLPVALMQSLVVTVPQLRWDEAGQPKDTKDSMLGRALTYLVLFSTLNQFLRWSIGAKLLSSVEEASYEEAAAATAAAEEDDLDHEGAYTVSGHYRDEAEQERLIHFDEHDTDQRNGSGGGDGTASQNPTDPIPPPITIRRATGDVANGEENDNLSPSHVAQRGKPGRTDPRNAAWARSFPNSPDDGAPSPPLEDLDDPIEGAPARRRSLLHTLIVRPAQAVNRFMTMPLWAAIFSLVVALIGPLQRFVDSLEPVVGALKTSGACSIPLTMVVLGSYFYEDKSALDSLGRGGINTAQTAALGGTGQNGNGNGHGNTSDPQLTGIRSGESTLVGGNTGAAKRRSLPWVRNPWSSNPPSEDAGSRSGSASGSLSASGMLSASQSEINTDDGGDGASEAGTAAGMSEGGASDGTRAQQAWAKVAERNAARNSRKGVASSSFSSSPAVPATAGRGATGSWREQARQKQMKKMERRTIVVAIASRMLFTPVVLIPTAAWYAVATRYNVMDDPVFITSACLLIGSPPALTLAQITSQNASGNSGFERLISKTIFVSYAILAAPTTIALVLAALLIAQYDH